MPIQLVLTEDQARIYNMVIEGGKTKKSNLPTPHNGRIVPLTADNYNVIRDEVKALHLKKFKVKNKKAEHLEICFYAQQILNKLNSLEREFTPYLSEDNDNIIGIVSDPEEEIRARRAQALTEMIRLDEEMGLLDPPYDNPLIKDDVEETDKDNADN
jgi:hypothetical protein